VQPDLTLGLGLAVLVFGALAHADALVDWLVGLWGADADLDPPD
jgi:hypothetical protein